MDCSAAREMLALIRPDSGDADQPQLAPAKVHLEQCADCQAAFDAQQKSDRELSHAMRRVTVPVDLKARLLAQLATATAPKPPAAPQVVPSTLAEPAVAPTVVPQPARRGWRRRELLAVASAALLVMAFTGGWWFLENGQKVELAIKGDAKDASKPDLLRLAHLSVDELPAFERSFQPDLPEREIQMPAPAEALKSVYGLQYQRREIGAVIPYQAARQGRRLNVVLVVVNLRRVDVPDLKSVGDSFLQAVPYYHKGYATRVWRKGQNLYVCYVLSKRPDDLERLGNQSATT